MPYDPTLPVEGAEADAAQMRAQFAGLVEMIEAIPAGPEGPPGEVSPQTLDDAISGTAGNPQTVADLALIVSEPPTQAEMQAVVDKVNELLGALRRF